MCNNCYELVVPLILDETKKHFFTIINKRYYTKTTHAIKYGKLGSVYYSGSGVLFYSPFSANLSAISKYNAMGLNVGS